MFVLVAGPPGSGKSTLARPLAEQLSLPLMAKDPIKEAPLPGPLIEVRCSCPKAVAQARYRARTGTRHGGHLDLERQPDELWNEQNSTPLGIAPVIIVDTTAPVDVSVIAARIQQLLRP